MIRNVGTGVVLGLDSLSTSHDGEMQFVGAAVGGRGLVVRTRRVRVYARVWTLPGGAASFHAETATDIEIWGEGL